MNVTNGLTLRPRGVLEAEVLGATAGLVDQLNVQGTVNLSNAILTLTVNFVPASPTAITIIANDGVAGEIPARGIFGEQLTGEDVSRFWADQVQIQRVNE